jgi:hypothetical protein
MAASAPSSNTCSPERRLIAWMSNTLPSPATLPSPIAHTTDAKLAQAQYRNGRLLAMPSQ